MKKFGFKGYVFSRELDGNFTPQRVQNLVIREYAKKNDKTYLLSATEYYMEECFLMLEALVEEAHEYEAVVFYSTHHLPKNEIKRNKILNTLLEKKTEIHFALEELAIKSREDIKIIDNIFLTRALSHTQLPHL